MGSQEKSSKNSKFLENLQDRTQFLRKLSQDNHVRRMNLARNKGENLQANFVIPSNFPKLDSKMKPQNCSVIDSKQKPARQSDTKDSKRYPCLYTKSPKINIKNKTNDLRRKYSPFVILNASDHFSRVFCVPDGKSKAQTQPKVETPRKYLKYGDKTDKKKSIKGETTVIKYNKKESAKKDIEDKDANHYQPQKNKKPPRLKNVIKSTKRKLKSKYQDLAYEQDNQHHKAGLCKGFIRSKTCFDENKVNTVSPEIPRPSFKKNITRNPTNTKFKKGFSKELAHLEKFRNLSGDNVTVLSEYTQTDSTVKKCSSSETNLGEIPIRMTRSSSLDPLGGNNFRNKRELSPAPVKSKIPIALTRIKHVNDSGYKMDKFSKGTNEKQRQKIINELESKLGDPVSKIKRSENRKSLRDKFSEKQKCIEAAIGKGSFEFPFPSDAEVCNQAKDSEWCEAPCSEPDSSDNNLTDWSEFEDKFDQVYKKDNYVKPYSTDLHVLNENKTLDKPENGLKYSKNKEVEKYMKDCQPNYDFLQSPIEKLMKEIKSAINLFNTDEVIDDDKPQSNLCGTPEETSEKGQKKKKVKKGRKGGWKTKTSRRGRV